MNPNKSMENIKQLFYEIIKFVTLFSGVVIFGVLIWYIILISKGYYHSDCTDTIFWAEAMLDGKTIMNPDFGYACLLPFGGNLIMAPFVAIFGVGMKAQIIGMVIFALLFTLSIVYMCRTMELNYKWTSLCVASILLVLMASSKLREIFWEHIIYYSLGVMFLMLGIGFVFAILKQEKISIRHIVLLGIWTTLCSTNGTQALATYCLPVIGAIVLERFLDSSIPLFSSNNKKEGIIIAIMCISVLLGLVIAKIVNNDIVAGYQTAYSGFDPISQWADNFMSIFPEAFRLFGITAGEHELYSIDGIFILLKIVFVLMILLVPVGMLIMYRKFESKAYRIMILAHTILSLIILVCWIFGMLNSACWRLSPIFVTGTILCIMLIKHLHEKKTFTRFVTVMGAFTALILCVISFDVFSLYEDNQSESNRQLQAIGEFLESKDLEYGYATFWNAGAITLLTDSEVKVRNISQTTMGDLSPRIYQSNYNWYRDNSYDKYFIILDNAEYEPYIYSEKYVEPIEAYYVENRHILVYDYNIMELK